MPAISYQSYQNAVYITPSDTVTFPPVAALLIEGAGAVTFFVDMLGGQTNVQFNTLGGTLLPIAVTRVYNTGLAGSPKFTGLW